MIRIRDLSVRAGEFRLTNIQLEIPSGAYAVLMGPTGCGKSTILEVLCGLKPIVSGTVEINGVDVTRLRPAARGIGYVPQDAALFATMSVRDQLGFALRLRRWSNQARTDRVKELAGLLGIEHLLDRKPDGLSGGEKQRVALGRALAFRPAVLCLDEPLSALDEKTHEEICALLESARSYTDATVLHITHSSREAARLADVIFRLRDGAIFKEDRNDFPVPIDKS